jgi:hypothetical protein
MTITVGNPSIILAHSDVVIIGAEMSVKVE